MLAVLRQRIFEVDVRICFLIFLVALCLSTQSKGAEFRCLDNRALGRVIIRHEHHVNDDDEIARFAPRNPDEGGAFRWEGENEAGKNQFCFRVAIEGDITSGDADKLEWLLVSHSRYFKIRSSGGSLLEAMTMGRLLRLNYAGVEAKGSGKVACGAPGQPVCCASACALVDRLLTFGARV